jgi:flagellar biosynthesis protein FlhF
MQFETFRGRDVAEAVAAVKAAFGPNAVIASTRHVTNGRAGAMATSFVEVRAAASGDRSAAASRAPFLREMVRRTPLPQPAPTTTTTTTTHAALATAPTSPTTRADVAMESELRAVRTMLEELANATRPRGRVAAMLNAAGIEGPLATELAGGASKLGKGGPELRKWLREKIGARLSVRTSPVDEPGRRLIACVGPTGVGKTTTLAKLAARAYLEKERDVSVITLDTFRVGAVEQMRRFMDIMGVPLHVANDQNQFVAALEKCKDAEIVLVDTASRAPSDRVAMGMLADCLASAQGRTVDVLLAIPAMIRARDVERLHSVYETCPPTGLVITKLDETDQIGGTVHAAVRGKVPLVHLCRGPRVPEDLEDATVDAVLDALFPVAA